MAKSKTEKIMLGSGKLYYQEYTGEVPDVKTACADANILGYIKGGATLEYTPTFYTAKDDLGVVTKTILTEEEANLKSGLITWNLETLNILVDASKSTNANGVTTLKIGGAANRQDKDFVIIFKYEDNQDGNMYVMIVGRNQGAMSLAFATDAETTVDAEFKAIPQDSDGTLITIVEEPVVSA